MGLDAVEIIMRVERAFGLTIPNERASQMRTVGDLCAYVLRETGAEGSETCMSSAAFYRTRRALIETVSIDRSQVRLDAKLEALLPKRDRRIRWRAVEGHLGLRIPVLSHPRWVQLAILALSTLLTLILLIPVSLHVYTGLLLTLLILLPIVGYLMIVRATPFLATDFPAGETTVRGLTKSIVALNYGRLAEKLQMKDEEAIWLAVQGIVCDQMQLRPADVTYGSTWQELGIE